VFPRDGIVVSARKLLDETLVEAVRAESAQLEQDWIRASLRLNYHSEIGKIYTAIVRVEADAHVAQGEDAPKDTLAFNVGDR
jgi:hypothetical protein